VRRRALLEQRGGAAGAAGFDRFAEKGERGRQQHLDPHEGLAHVDPGVDFLPERSDLQAKPVAGPGRAHLGATGDMILELADPPVDPPPRLLRAKLVREVDADRCIAHALQYNATRPIFND